IPAPSPPPPAAFPGPIRRRDRRDTRRGRRRLVRRRESGGLCPPGLLARRVVPQDHLGCPPATDETTEPAKRRLAVEAPIAERSVSVVDPRRPAAPGGVPCHPARAARGAPRHHQRYQRGGARGGRARALARSVDRKSTRLN